MRTTASILAAPSLCLLLLGGIALEHRAHTRPEDAAPFHKAAAAALEAWPREYGQWNGTNTKLPEAAIRLLRPNVTVSRRYFNKQDPRLYADLLVVQCRDPIDMSGHYPPNCYPNNGLPLVGQADKTWVLGEGADQLTIRGKEYQFDTGGMGSTQRQWVYNFFVLPGRGIVPDMKEVREATGDYQRRFFGAAQVQLVFSTDLGPEVRDQVFKELIGPNVGVLRILNPKGL